MRLLDIFSGQDPDPDPEPDDLDDEIVDPPIEPVPHGRVEYPGGDGVSDDEGTVR